MSDQDEQEEADDNDEYIGVHCIYIWYIPQDPDEEVQRCLFPAGYWERTESYFEVLNAQPGFDHVVRTVVHQGWRYEAALYHVSAPITRHGRRYRTRNHHLVHHKLRQPVWGNAVLVVMERESGEEVSISRLLPWHVWLGDT